MSTRIGLFPVESIAGGDDPDTGCADDCTHPAHRVRPLILGIVAPSGGGKTTVCDHLESKYGFIRVHVAEPIKAAFEVMFGVGPEYCERPLVERAAAFLGGVTPREVLEQLGLRLREVSPECIPLRARERISRLLRDNPAARIIVDGVRMVPEAAMVRSLGGYVVRIDGGRIDERKPFDLKQAEVDADFILHFAKDLEEIHREIDEMMRPMIGPLPGDNVRSVFNRAHLDELIRQARAAYEAMTPAEREAHDRAQRDSWVRGNTGLDRQERDERRTRRVPRFDCQDEPLIAPAELSP